MGFDPHPVTLEGQTVRLEPLDAHHAGGLLEIGSVDEDWAYMPRGCFGHLGDCRTWIDEAKAAADQVPFAIIDKASGLPAGSTRYLTIRREHRSLEIGWTWLGRNFQRSAVNTETKLLLLTHAFDDLGAIRVEVKTDQRNTRSQAALERIGAVREGVLRQHMVVQEGFLRNSVYFSILDEEWPAVKAHLEAKLGRG